MDVSCPKCDTVYEFNADQVRGGRGVTLKCSQCDHLFRLESPGGAHDESQRRWMVRKRDSGDVLYFTGFDTLHKWIMDGRIDSKDAISRTGESWKVIKTIGEFTPIFQVVASIASLTSSKNKDKQEEPREESVTPAIKRTEKSSGGHQSSGRSSGPVPKTRTHPGKHSYSTGRASPGQQPSDSDGAPSPTAPNAKESPQRRTETRQAHRTVPGRPGNVSAQTPMISTTSTKDSQAPVAEPQPTPALRNTPYRGGGRFDQEAQQDSKPLEEVDDDWSLGELDVAQKDAESIAEVQGVRRWPLLVAIIVVAAAGVAIWQTGLLEEFVERPGASTQNIASDTDEPVGEVGGAAVQGAREGVDRALSQAGEELRAAVLPFVEEAVGQGRVRVEAAVEAAKVEAARAARPSVGELIRSGQRYLDRGDGRGARRNFQRALDEDSGNFEAMIGLGWAFLSMDDVDSAITRFRAANRQNASRGEGLIGIGRAERVRGDRRAALQAYEEYLERFPGGPDASIARFQSEQLRQSLGD